jgi:hypothetical protein
MTQTSRSAPVSRPRLGVPVVDALLIVMQDDRARQLGRRIVYNEWPEALGGDQRIEMDPGRLARLNAAEGSWTSIAKALTDIDKLLPTATPATAKMLEGYSCYVRSLAISYAA